MEPARTTASAKWHALASGICSPMQMTAAIILWRREIAWTAVITATHMETLPMKNTVTAKHCTEMG